MERIFIMVINQVLSKREKYLEALRPIIEKLSNTSDIDNEAQILNERSAGIDSQLEKLVADNASRFKTRMTIKSVTLNLRSDLKMSGQCLKNWKTRSN